MKSTYLLDGISGPGTPGIENPFNRAVHVTFSCTPDVTVNAVLIHLLQGLLDLGIFVGLTEQEIAKNANAELGSWSNLSLHLEPPSNTAPHIQNIWTPPGGLKCLTYSVACRPRWRRQVL